MPDRALNVGDTRRGKNDLRVTGSANGHRRRKKEKKKKIDADMFN